MILQFPRSDRRSGYSKVFVVFPLFGSFESRKYKLGFFVKQIPVSVCIPPMTSPRLLLFAAYASTLPFLLLVLLVSFSVNCHAEKYQHPNIHSCGDDIRNISFPFRLKANPYDTCGDKNFELSCEKNRTVLNLGRGKFYVQAINYDDGLIRVVDVGIQRNNCSALPLHDYSEFEPSLLGGPWHWPTEYVSAVIFLSCENPVNSPRYIDSSPSVCKNASLSSSSTKGGYSYVLVAEHATLSDVADSCSVDMIALRQNRPISMRNEGNVSLLDVLNELADGFVLSWRFESDRRCRRQTECFGDGHSLTATCTQYFQAHFPIGDFILFVRALIIIFIGMMFALRILCMPCVFGFLIYKFKRRHLSMFDSIEGFLRSQNHLMPISYSYSDIKRMTKGFRHKLGEGGYGSVYKAKLRSGRLVAVKVLGKSKANGQEFINEVMTIGRIHHTNVVRLVGYCAESSKRALVYDFMTNGSLEKYIFSQEGYVSLSCEQMYEISLGVAHGIEYLHRGCEMQILHFDIKPHNILLDNDFTPKVSDFGLAKLYPTDDSIVCLTAARGTMGYMAPELFYKNIGGISYKADVYSFGMLLMEMAGRRRNLNAFADHTSQIYFPSWIYDQLREGRDVELGEATEEESVMVKKMIIVALWCIQLKPIDRLR